MYIYSYITLTKSIYEDKIQGGGNNKKVEVNPNIVLHNIYRIRNTRRSQNIKKVT